MMTMMMFEKGGEHRFWLNIKVGEWHHHHMVHNDDDDENDEEETTTKLVQ